MNVTLPKNINFNFSPQSKSFRNPMIEVVLLVVACGLFYWFIIMPKNAQISQQNNTLSQVQAEEKKISGTVADLKKMVEQLSANTKEITNLDEAMPLDAKVLRLRMLLENLSQSVGLSISNVNVAYNSDVPWAGDKLVLAHPYSVPRSVQRLSGTVSVVGTYSQVVALIEKIEKSGRVININSVAIDTAENGNLNIVLVLDAFYLGPNTDTK
ncbi:MAG: hypothetical protein AAB729_03215 [Patescibacteria group bacterium]